MKQPLVISVAQQNGKALIKIIGIIANWKDSAMNFESQIDELVTNGITDCDLYLRTQGGDVFEANDIVNAIKKFTGKINGVGGSLVASAGSYIAIHCDTFTMPGNGMFMIHKPQYDCGGNVDQIEADLKMLKSLTDNYRSAYATKTGIKENKIEDNWKNDWWMSAQEAANMKFITGITDDEPIDPSSLADIKTRYKSIPTAFLNITEISKTQNQIITNEMDKKNIITVLALAETVTDVEVMAALSGLKAKADKADALQAQVDTLLTERDSVKVKALLDKAIEKKQILPGERPHFEKIAKSDFVTAEAIINARPEIKQLSGVVTDSEKPGEDRSAWKYEDYQKKDPQALVKLAKENTPEFKQLFKAHYGTDYAE